MYALVFARAAAMNVFQSVYSVPPIFISETVQPEATEKFAVTFWICMQPPVPDHWKPSSIVPDEDVVNMTSKLPPRRYRYRQLQPAQTGRKRGRKRDNLHGVLYRSYTRLVMP